MRLAHAVDATGEGTEMGGATAAARAGMVPIIAVAGRKGGSGKSTTALNAAGALAERGCRVLLVDLDPQASLTRLVLKTGDVPDGIGDRILDQKRGIEGLARPTFPGIDVFPGNRSVETASFTFADNPRGAFYLRRLLARLEGYHVALLDTPPQLGFALHSALLAAQMTLLPTLLVQQDLDALADTIELQRDYSELGGATRMLIVPNAYRPDSSDQPALEDLGARYADVVCAPIPQAVAIKHALNDGSPVVVYQPRSRAAAAYRALAQRVEEEIGHAD